jgi:hypothetical protein
VQLAADFGEDPAFGQVGGCVVTRDGEGVVADGVEEYPIADFTGEAEEGREFLVTLGAVCVCVCVLVQVLSLLVGGVLHVRQWIGRAVGV